MHLQMLNSWKKREFRGSYQGLQAWRSFRRCIKGYEVPVRVSEFEDLLWNIMAMMNNNIYPDC